MWQKICKVGNCVVFCGTYTCIRISRQALVNLLSVQHNCKAFNESTCLDFIYSCLRLYAFNVIVCITAHCFRHLAMSQVIRHVVICYHTLQWYFIVSIQSHGTFLVRFLKSKTWVLIANQKCTDYLITIMMRLYILTFDAQHTFCSIQAG